MAHAVPDEDTLPPTGRRRRRVRLFIVGFVLFQLLVPLTYYLRDDPYDERFAWRMFSAIRMHECRTEARETVDGVVRPIRLLSVIHEAWGTTLRRNRKEVIRAFLRRRCQETGVREVEVVNHCVSPDGTRLEPLVYRRDCETLDMTEPSSGP